MTSTPTNGIFYLLVSILPLLVFLPKSFFTPTVDNTVFIWVEFYSWLREADGTDVGRVDKLLFCEQQRKVIVKSLGSVVRVNLKIYLGL